MGRFKELALRLLERLVQAAIVSTPVTGLEGYAGLSRFDLQQQINEVEARQVCVCVCVYCCLRPAAASL